MTDYKIDIVVPWVDGNDPNWLREKAKYKADLSYNSATSNRFRDWDLMRYWFRGIEKYAPWVNQIFFVTWGHIPDWLNTECSKISIVRHDEYIPADILPVFNANPIEMNLYRVKDLSEHFVLFNDDTFVISDTVAEDFFVDGKPCESALLGVISSQDPKDVFPHILINNSAVLNKHFSKREVIKKNWRKFFTLKYGKDVIRNCALFPFAYFSNFQDFHLPASLLKSSLEELFRLEPEYMKKATSNRFRSHDDVNQWLVKNYNMCKGNFCPRNPKWGRKFELGIDEGAIEYIKEQKGKVICINDSTDELDFDMLQKQLKEAFESILPETSVFER